MRPFSGALSLALAGLLSPWGAVVAGGDFNPSYAGIEALHRALESRQITSKELVRYYQCRIERFNRHGPQINAVITLNPTALEDAARLDEARAVGAHHGLLYGIPFLAKDNFDTAGVVTSGGSAALKQSVPTVNAFVLQRLLDQGAILVGKANMSELAASYGRLGYSSAGGLTLNPYNTARDVSGSSSGSAAAVAADFATFALGTDTSGSIRGPAAVAGLVGLRPTLGLTSRSHVIPLSLTIDTTGVLTHTVRDLAIVLDTIAARDSDDASTEYQPEHRGSYLAAFDSGALKHARLGVIRNFRGANAEVDGVEQTALRVLTTQGAIVLPVTLPKEFEQLWDLVLGPVGEAEFKPQFERYLRSLPAGPPRTLAQLIDISASDPVANSATPVNPDRLRALKLANDTQLTDSPTYIHILTELIPSIRRQLETLMRTQHLTALVFSTMPCPATPRFDQPDPTYRCRSDDPQVELHRCLGGVPRGDRAGGPGVGQSAGRILVHGFALQRSTTASLRKRVRGCHCSFAAAAASLNPALRWPRLVAVVGTKGSLSQPSAGDLRRHGTGIFPLTPRVAGEFLLISKRDSGLVPRG
jgi:amidase